MTLRLAIFLVATLLFGQDADRFHVLLQQRADLAALRASAAQWEASEHDPVRHLLAVEQIAKGLIDLDPALSLDYCRRVRSAPQLWPIMLDAEVRLRDWPMAERYGEAVMEEIDAGRLYSRVSDVAEEARIRTLYATALDHQGKPEAAAKQRAIVDPNSAPNDSLRAEGAALATAERARRIANLRNEVLAGEIRMEAPPLQLRDLKGREVSVADFRGQPFVAVFWATWCAPCVEELRQLKPFFEKNPGRFAAISVDETPATAGDFARKQGYRFPIFFAGRATERAYTPAMTMGDANIPQLYVFDAVGKIRFRMTAPEDDQLLSQKVEWMMAAALK